MALSKLAISLIAGIGSAVAVGGITAGVVVSRSNTVAETTNENEESNSKDNRSSSNTDTLMADESRKNDSTDTVSQIGMKDPGVKRSAETESKMAKQPDKTTSHTQDTSGDSSPMQNAGTQPASTGPTTASADAERRGDQREKGEDGAQKASVGTGDREQEAPGGKVGSAADGTTGVQELSPDRSVAGDRHSQGEEIQSRDDEK